MIKLLTGFDMEKLEDKYKKVQRVSRFIFYGSILLMLSTIFPTNAENIGIFRWLIALGVILFFLYWMIPVFFLLAGKQGLAAVWAGGLAKWEVLKNTNLNNPSFADKLSMYINFLTSVVMVIILLLFLNFIRG